MSKIFKDVHFGQTKQTLYRAPLITETIRIRKSESESKFAPLFTLEEYLQNKHVCTFHSKYFSIFKPYLTKFIRKNYGKLLVFFLYLNHVILSLAKCVLLFNLPVIVNDNNTYVLNNILVLGQLCTLLFRDTVISF